MFSKLPLFFWECFLKNCWWASQECSLLFLFVLIGELSVYWWVPGDPSVSWWVWIFWHVEKKTETKKKTNDQVPIKLMVWANPTATLLFFKHKFSFVPSDSGSATFHVCYFWTRLSEMKRVQWVLKLTLNFSSSRLEMGGYQKKSVRFQKIWPYKTVHQKPKTFQVCIINFFFFLVCFCFCIRCFMNEALIFFFFFSKKVRMTVDDNVSWLSCNFWFLGTKYIVIDFLCECLISNNILTVMPCLCQQMFPDLWGKKCHFTA